ncbi:MAG: hypothetical protein GKR90_25580 [Pseudomonadales bacterium]|nr:hypothetical protein [Pseudomonadales bacterium]
MIDPKAIRAKLDVFVQKHPELRNLRKLIGSDLIPSKEFLTAVDESDLSYGVSSLLLRALLEDPWIYGVREQEMSPGLHIKILNFIVNSPNSYLDPVSIKNKDRLPQFLGSLGKRPSIGYLLKHYVVQPYFSDKTGPEVRRHIAPLLDSLLLTEAMSRRLMEGRTTAAIYNHYFDTGHETLDVRNALLYGCELLKADERGGRIQSKIPRAVSDALRIKRVSVPELMAKLDVLSMAILGAFSLDGVEKDEDTLMIKRLIAARSQLDLAQVAEACSKLCLLTPELAEKVQQDLKGGVRGAVYRTGLLFNPRRLYVSERNKDPFRQHAKWVTRIDREIYHRLIVRHYDGLDESFVRFLEVMLDQFPDALDMRAAANIAYFVTQCDETASISSQLPSVARFFLGQQEYSPSGKGTKPKGARKTRATEREIELPGLDALLRGLLRPVGYVLLPGFTGEIPIDGYCVFPRCFAGAYGDIPKSLTLVGPDALDWGLPIEKALRISEHVDWHVLSA